jgi:urease accessory protein
MGTPGAAGYRERVQRGDACGQMTAVHGLIGHATGLDETAVCALSAYGLAVGTIGAALRVGLLGHVEGQAILARMRAVVDEAVASPLPAVDACHAYTPMAEIAMMRHETGSGRMFAS